jgi:hypothetical protein
MLREDETRRAWCMDSMFALSTTPQSPPHMRTGRPGLSAQRVESSTFFLAEGPGVVAKIARVPIPKALFASFSGIRDRREPIRILELRHF